MGTNNSQIEQTAQIQLYDVLEIVCTSEEHKEYIVSKVENVKRQQCAWMVKVVNHSVTHHSTMCGTIIKIQIFLQKMNGTLQNQIKNRNAAFKQQQIWKCLQIICKYYIVNSISIDLTNLYTDYTGQIKVMHPQLQCFIELQDCSEIHDNFQHNIKHIVGQMLLIKDTKLESHCIAGYSNIFWKTLVHNQKPLMPEQLLTTIEQVLKINTKNNHTRTIKNKVMQCQSLRNEYYNVQTQLLTKNNSMQQKQFNYSHQQKQYSTTKNIISKENISINSNVYNSSQMSLRQKLNPHRPFLRFKNKKKQVPNISYYSLTPKMQMNMNSMGETRSGTNHYQVEKSIQEDDKFVMNEFQISGMQICEVKEGDTHFLQELIMSKDESSINHHQSIASEITQ